MGIAGQKPRANAGQPFDHETPNGPGYRIKSDLPRRANPMEASAGHPRASLHQGHLARLGRQCQLGTNQRRGDC